MATYRNDTTSTFHVPNISGVLTTVAPTESIETYMVLGTGWTKTADTPYKVTSSSVFLNTTDSGITDGDWQLVQLPEGIEAKSVLIQVHNGATTDFTSFASNPPVFHFSTTGSTNKDFIQCVGSFSIDIFDVRSKTIGFVRAAAGNYCVVTVLS